MRRDQVRRWSGRARRSCARSRSRSMPPPSSVTVMASMPARWRASTRMRAVLRLAGGRRCVRRLDAVIDGVAEQVRQRRFQLLEDVAIHLGVAWPSISRRTCLSSVRAMSRTRRGKPCAPSANGRIRLAMTSR